MFKKLKDKLAEEVKSSPQRIQQFAQAAQVLIIFFDCSNFANIIRKDLTYIRHTLD